MRSRLSVLVGVLASLVLSLVALPAFAQGHEGGEATLVLPDLASVNFLGSMPGSTLLSGGIIVCVLGLVFGLVIYRQLKNMAVHKSMLEISELIYETCKTYLVTQGKFILLLEVFIGIIMIFYFGVLRHFEPVKVAVILLFSLIGIGGSYGVAWFGIRINTFANSRTAFASLKGKPYPVYAIPLKAGMSIGMLLISVELLLGVELLASVEILLSDPLSPPAMSRCTLYLAKYRHTSPPTVFGSIVFTSACSIVK